MMRGDLITVLLLEVVMYFNSRSRLNSGLIHGLLQKAKPQKTSTPLAVQISRAKLFVLIAVVNFIPDLFPSSQRRPPVL